MIPEHTIACGYSNPDVDRILVVHNPSENEVFVPCDEITDPEEWYVIADAYSAGTDVLMQGEKTCDGFTQIRIEMRSVYVPGRNASVVVRRSRK
jgi:hypothetical protein